MEATVSEIHAYPLRPEGYAEPLFHDHRSRREILEHLARSGWLWRASEAPRPARSEPRCSEPDRAEPGRVIASWREVDRWWVPVSGVDRVCYLVRTASGGERVRARAPRRACAA